MVAVNDYEFTNQWFDLNRRAWDDLITRLLPAKILEIGAFEGRYTCYLINQLARKIAFTRHCIDTWQGAIELQEGGQADSDMNAVEAHFHKTQNWLLASRPKQSTW